MNFQVLPAQAEPHRPDALSHEGRPTNNAVIVLNRSQFVRVCIVVGILAIAFYSGGFLAGYDVAASAVPAETAESVRLE